MKRKLSVILAAAMLASSFGMSAMAEAVSYTHLTLPTSDLV